MKKMFLFLTAIMLFSCNITDGLVGADGADGVDGTNGVTVSSFGTLYDGNNTALGNVTSASAGGIDLLTSEGYFLGLKWDGTFYRSKVYFSGTDATGTAFATEEKRYYSKNTYFVNEQFYTFRDAANGVAVADLLITGYESFYDYEGILTNANANIDLAYDLAYVLKEVTRAEVGLPTTITLPLSIVFE